MTNSRAILLLCSLLAGTAQAAGCGDPADTFDKYDQRVDPRERKDLAPGYYVMTYSWAPNHCRRVDRRSQQPGGRDYLQCGSGRRYGYVLHGLWPQGSRERPNVYPRACEGDQPRIDRALLEKYLCMSPSLWLLQHEYEYHGTCMHDESLETPQAYFDTALRLHQGLKLPETELPDTPASRQWLLANNPHHKPGSIRYETRSREWQFCYDHSFMPVDCAAPGRSRQTAEADASCTVKGNINRRNGNRLYFTREHPNYAGVRIDTDAGERCFASEQEAVRSGWREAPRH